MSKRRMFSSDIINSDTFIEMSLASQALYFHLAMTADDDGFINSATRTIRAVCGSPEHIEELIKTGFLIRFESGILLIRHWNIHNQIKKDRYTPTMHINELEQVIQIDKVYYLKTETDCIHSGSTMEPQISKEKISIDKDSIGESREGPPSFTVPSISELTDYAKQIGYSNFNPAKFLAYYNTKGWGNPHGLHIDWHKFVNLWKEREKDFQANKPSYNNQFNDFQHQDYDFEEIERTIRAN